MEVSEAAYLDEDLELDDVEREEAAALAAVPGGKPVTVTGCLDWIRRYGRDDSIEATALLLPTDQYHRVVAANRAADRPNRPTRRRNRR